MHTQLFAGLTTMLFILLPFHAMAQESDKTALTNTNKPAQSEIIAQATQSVYDSLYALAPKFKKCYNKALKYVDNDGMPLNYTGGRIDLEYDENGIIYWKDAPGFKPKPMRAEASMTGCYKSTLPKSFDIHLQDVVSNYPDNVQKFGRLRFLYNPNSDIVEIVEAFSSPIGTTHNLVKEYNKHDAPHNINSKSMKDEDKIRLRLLKMNKHYSLWLKRRGNNDSKSKP